MNIRSIVALLAVVVLSGCNIIQPQVADGDYVPLIAASIGVATSGQSQTIIPPDGGTEALCKNCKGRGKVGDGRTMVICPMCNGTGKGSGEAPEVSAPEESPETEVVAPGANFKPDEAKAAENPVVALIYSPTDFICPGCEVVKGEVEKLHKEYGWTDKQIRIELISDARAMEIGISAYPTLEVRNGSKVLLRKAAVLSASELTALINPLRMAANEK